MSNNLPYAMTIRYERSLHVMNQLVPLLVRSEMDHNGRLRPVRITQLAWKDVPFVGAEILTEEELDGWRAIESPQYNTRASLLLSGGLTPARDWPFGPTLALDQPAMEVHERDYAEGVGGITNPAIEALFEQYPHLLGA